MVSLEGLVGIHCTHGINRTGYAIVFLLMTRDKRKPSLSEAIQWFETARGSKITNEILLQDLYQRFGQPHEFHAHKLGLKEFNDLLQHKVNELVKEGE